MIEHSIAKHGQYYKKNTLWQSVFASMPLNHNLAKFHIEVMWPQNPFNASYKKIWNIPKHFFLYSEYLSGQVTYFWDYLWHETLLIPPSPHFRRSNFIMDYLELRFGKYLAYNLDPIITNKGIGTPQDSIIPPQWVVDPEISVGGSANHQTYIFAELFRKQ